MNSQDTFARQPHIVGVFACLVLVLALAIAGPLHAHDRLVQADSSCTLCHAGEHSLTTPPALDAGKPSEVILAECISLPESTAPANPESVIRASRAPPTPGNLEARG